MNVFSAYNEAIWPVQILFYLLGIAAITLAIWYYDRSVRKISIILAFMWGWMGIGYHMIFFSTINAAAYIFGSVFLLQGLLFLFAGGYYNKLHFEFQNNIYGIMGGLFIAYALVIYPYLGTVFGHIYPESPMFGVAPCPTTIFTFGLLLWTTKKIPGWILIIPGIWSLIGFTAALNLGMTEDIGLLIAGIISIPMILFHNRRLKTQTAPT